MKLFSNAVIILINGKEIITCLLSTAVPVHAHMLKRSGLEHVSIHKPRVLHILNARAIIGLKVL